MSLEAWFTTDPGAANAGRSDLEAIGRHLAFDALSALSMALFVVGVDLGVHLANAEAARLIAGSGGLRVTGGRLTVDDRKADAQLRFAVRCAASGVEDVTTGQAILAARGPADRLLSLAVRRVPGERLGERPRLAAVIATEAAPCLTASVAGASAAHGLTPAEARLLTALVAGESLNGYAERLRLSLHTVRGQAQALFNKTGRHRQAELVLMVTADLVCRMARGLSAGA